MLGWTIMFALMSLSGVVITLAEHAGSFWLKTGSVLFAMLFFLNLLARAVRAQAR